jgi:hypothetical protein
MKAMENTFKIMGLMTVPFCQNLRIIELFSGNDMSISIPYH